MKNIFLPFLLLFLTLSACKQNEPEEVEPTADFLYTIKGLTVSFSNLSKNAQSYSWDFGDGHTSVVKNPVHVYSSYDTYQVTLTATNSSKKSRASKSVSLTEQRIKASFTYKTEHPMKVVLTNTSSNATTYEWDFGDGTTSTEENPTHRYKGIGVYRITLTVRNGSKQDTYQSNVTIEAPSTCQLTGFVFNRIPYNNNYYQIQITDDYIFSKTTYLWIGWSLLSSANLPYSYNLGSPKTLSIYKTFVVRLYRSSSKTSGQADGKGFWTTSLTSSKLQTYPESITYSDSSASITLNFKWK